MSVERIYNVNLRQKAKKAPKWRRAKKVVNLLREFVAKHLKTENVKIAKELNEEIWRYGAKKARAKYKIRVVKDGGVAYVNLFGIEEKKKVKIEKNNDEREGKEGHSEVNEKNEKE